MCGICGFINFKTNLVKNERENLAVAHRMAEKLRHRGPDSWGEWVGEHAVFAHSRLAVIDVENGLQPMKRTVEGHEFVITYNGEIYNTNDIRNDLKSHGYEFTTASDTEVLLYAYIHYGEKCAEMLNGIYAFVIWDSMRQRIFACRDRFGVKPFFYTQKNDVTVFASELKSLFEYPDVSAVLDKTGLCELFALSPARTQGVGVFKDVRELRPARYMIINRHGMTIKKYWSLVSGEHKDSYEETIEKVLSGECSDEIFGGYPWFREKKAFETHGFPWCYDLSIRNNILIDSVRETLDIDNYSRMRYEESIAEVPIFDGDNDEEKRRREISYLNINWFMTNLLDRKDRMSMASGLEVRVPFCDHRLVEYVWNIPWEMKNRDNVSKNVLREAAKGILPEDVRLRRKSPYPKTHNPHYEEAVKTLLDGIISDPNAPILALCDKTKLTSLLDGGSSDYGKPFFGQLMAGPQFIGYIVQMNYLLRDYKVRIL